ncbi:T9SS type A sorting domain-containing protein [Polaribacter haliotis]|uniref:T9SS type A sorting domain-containing protein n=1 Tax=Polaribacter haliotis TaxID=1888915 RepID=A0A7L8AGB7_9FLAO|nr:T9SS type A sorting domain-containing protein [Polaribacter haliotis]QOD60984.1 T9SS type A sorting domain-containing protein [Polaribacter haliotis]
MNKKTTLIFFFLLTNTLLVFCQNSINTSSGNVKTNNGSFTYSVGQIFNNQYSSTKGSISFGVQNAYEIYTTLGLLNTDINLKMAVYPNPIVNNLNLSIKNYITKDLTFVIYDILGKKQIANKILAEQTIINVKKLPNTIYFLKIIKNNKPIKIFKIIKK